MGFFSKANNEQSDVTVGEMPAPTLAERRAEFSRKLAANSYGFFLLFFILGAIGLSQLSLAIAPLAGVYANATALALLLLLALWEERARLAALAASVLPLVTMVNLALPQGSAFAQAGVFYGMLLALAFVYRKLFAREQPMQNIRLRLAGYVLVLPLFIVIGQALGVMAFGLLGGTGGELPFEGVAAPLLTAGLGLFVVAEELFFRGLLQERAGRVMHPVLAIVLTSGAYAALTLPLGNLAVTLFAAFANLLLSSAYYLKPNLILTITTNATLKLLHLGLFVTFA